MPNNHIKSLKLRVKEKEHLFNKFISLYNKGKHLDNNLFFLSKIFGAVIAIDER